MTNSTGEISQSLAAGDKYFFRDDVTVHIPAQSIYTNLNQQPRFRKERHQMQYSILILEIT